MYDKVIYFTILILIIYLIYIKAYSQFWSNMPMFFYSKPHYWFISPKQLLKKEDLHNKKFMNNYNIDCKPLYSNELTEHNKFEIIQFIKNYYKHHKIFTIDKDLHKTMDLFFSQYQGTNDACYIGKYIKKDVILNNYRFDNSYTKLYGLLLIKPLYLNIEKKVLKTNYFSFLSTNKINFACGRGFKGARTLTNKNITSELIYNTGFQIFNKTFSHAIFKTYKKIHNVVPLLTNFEYMFDVKYISHKPYDKYFKLNKINDSNFNVIRECIESNYNNIFDNLIVCDILNLYEMIKHKHIHLFIVSFNNTISSIYFLKNNAILYKNEIVYDFISSILLINDDTHKKLFINNMYNIIDYLKKEYTIRYINIHNTSHNNILLQSMKNNYKELEKIQNYWYIVNYIMNPIETNKTLVYY